MVNRILTVGDDFTLDPKVKAGDANLPERLSATQISATIADEGGQFFAPGPLVEQDFTAQPDGKPTHADTGQRWTYYQNNATGADLRVINGRLTNTSSNAGASAGYAETEMPRPVTHLSADFDFAEAGYSTTNGVATFAVWKTSGVQINSGVMTVPDSPCHLVIGVATWKYGVFNGGVLTNILTGTFATPLAVGVELSASVDIVGETARITLPDGSTHTVADARIAGNAGRFACFEVYEFQTATDPKQGFLRVRADDRPAENIAGLVSVARLRKELESIEVDAPIATPATVATKWAPTTIETLTVPTAEADVKAGVTEITVTAPPSGRLLITLTGYVNINPDSRLLWGVRNGTSTLMMNSAVTGLKPSLDGAGAPIAGTGGYKGQATARSVLEGLTPGNPYVLRWRHWYTGGTGGTMLAHAGGGYINVMSAEPV